MRFAVLASGSRANATLVEEGQLRFLVDCGLSMRETQRRLLERGVTPESLSAIFLTHEHSDHIRSAESFSRKFKIPIYANEATASFLSQAYGFELFQSGQPFLFHEILVSPIPVSHDAHEPVGFTFASEESKLGLFTDLGQVTPRVKEAVKDVHALVIESNHDSELLASCGYPWPVKERIASRYGHLSNAEASELLFSLSEESLRCVVLAHLSERSNRPEIALALAGSRKRNWRLSCGSVTESSPWFVVGEEREEAQQARMARKSGRLSY
jgi:phosphoribosyl 1,2-cyclic phosphodiesterase